MRAASHVSVLRLVPSTLLLIALVPNPAAAFSHRCASMGGISAADCGCEHDEHSATSPSETEPRIAATPCCEVRQSQAREVTLRDQASDRRAEVFDLTTAVAADATTSEPEARGPVCIRGERDPPNQVAPLFKRHCSFLN